MRSLSLLLVSILPCVAGEATQSSTPTAPETTRPSSTANPRSANSQTSHAESSPEPSPLQIRILNAQTNKPVPNERLNVSFHEHQIGFHVLPPTDKLGIIQLHPGADTTTLHLLTNFFADCRPRAELYTNYSLTTLRNSGITTGNLCSSAHPDPKPGELLLFVIPKNAIRQYGQPPSTNLPHSDENPNAQPDNPFSAPR